MTSAEARGIEVVTIGTELLLGHTVDTNAAWLGRRLAESGIAVVRRTTVGDDAAAIRDAVGRALEQTGFVLCSGGLGPTEDDMTRVVVAQMYGRRLQTDPVSAERLLQRARSFGYEPTAQNMRQAEVPEGARVLPNDWGTAPGLVLEDARGTTVLLPGVPSEFKALFDAQVLPMLIDRGLAGGPGITHRTLRTTGIAESQLAARLAGIESEVAPITVAYLPGWDGVDVRLSDWRGQRELLREAEAMVRERIGSYVYGCDDVDLAEIVGEQLRQQRLTLALAESCTGGLITKRLTDAPGASDFLVAGFVTYADEAKVRSLRVSKDDLHEHGAVSGEVARAMARGARRAAHAQVALAVTGIAGPGGASEQKPVGTVWIGLSLRRRTGIRQYRFHGDRAEVRARSAQAALAWLWRWLR